MLDYNIAVIQGDGIGPEITQQALAVLKAAGSRYGFSVNACQVLMGGAAIDSCGVPLPDETLDICSHSDAVLLGAVGGPKWDSLPSDKRPEAGLLGIRSGLGLFCNLRPAKAYAPVIDSSPLRKDVIKNADLVIVRELTSGIYFGKRGCENADGIRSAFDTMQYTEDEIKRIAKKAFELASSRRRHLTSVDKANILQTSKLWRSCVSEMSASYPDVKVDNMYVDNCAMQLCSDPSQFDVILTSNMFGDILSDEASQITGSIGITPSASLREDKFGLFEPIHGSAPDIAGRDIADPLGAILSCAMMCRMSLSQPEAAAAIESSVDRYLEKYATADIYDGSKIKVGCSECGRIIAKGIC